jgi:hypothetical protein
MAILMVYKRNSQFVDLSELVEKLSSLGLTDTLKEYYDNPFKKEAKSSSRAKFPAIPEQIISISDFAR